MEERLPNYGGQAVIEGVMMRGRKTCAVAVRAPDKSIQVEMQPLGSLYQSRLMQTPFIRGLFVLWDALVLGMRALTFSANMQSEEDEQLDGLAITMSLVFSLVIGVGLFFLLPTGAAYLLERFLNWAPFCSNAVEGLIRLLLLIGYIWAIGFIPDIRRVYGYHGAEHKTINAFEAGAPLEVDQIQSFPKEHPRCGTAFLLTVVVFSILLFSAIGPLSLIPRLLSRILLLPLLASLAYEYIRFSSKLLRFTWAKPLVAPNLWLQRLTTREPDTDMIEVAITAFNAMRVEERISKETAV
ncbi:MAG TPA: DUF1385 domain-containing protein [Anaerolineales bacterium]|nr:DUF1385 domain-containing protein [Anaerolineales bacterium]